MEIHGEASTKGHEEKETWFIMVTIDSTYQRLSSYGFHYYQKTVHEVYLYRTFH